MRVALLHPIWDRSCATCEKYQCNADGTFLLRRDNGERYERGSRSPTPCHKCEKVPLGLRRQGADNRTLRAAAIELTDQNRQCWTFYRQCRAVNHWPDDPLVRWAAELLRDLYDECDREPMRKLASSVEGMTLALVTVLNQRKR